MIKKRKYKPFFDNKSCEICGKKAILFRIIKDKTYMLCNRKKCDFTIRVKHGLIQPIIGK